jgi:O-antigen ligase
MLKNSLFCLNSPTQAEGRFSCLRGWGQITLLLMPVALALASLLPYPAGRSLFVLPAAAFALLGTIITISALGLHNCRTMIRPALGFTIYSLAMMALIALNITLLHPSLSTIGNLKSLAALVLGLNLFVLTVMVMGQKDQQALRNMTLAIHLLLIVLGGQIIFSYLTGWGEIYDQNDGSRRAYGMAGDGFTMLLVFGCLWTILDKRWALGLIMGTALFMTGGRMGLLAAILCLLLCVPLMLGNSKKHLAKNAMLLMLAIASCIGILHIANHLRQNIAIAEIQPAKPSNTATAPNNASFAALRAYNAELPTHLRFINHYYYSALSTGAGRLIGLGAGLQMLEDNPLSGVGYGNSNAVFTFYASADRFNLQEKIGLPVARLQNERAIANQLVTTAAETGLPGLILFMLMCLSAVLIAGRTYLGFLRHPTISKQDNLVLACSIWSMVLMVGNQTATWFLPASPNLLWLYICLGLCAAHLAGKARA